MAMQQAVNPETGEVLFLVNNQWVPPTQTAVNEAGQKAYLAGNEWQLPPGATANTADEKPVTAEQKPMGVLDAINDVLTPSQATLGAGEKGFVNAKQAVLQGQIAQLANNQAADKEQYGEFYEKAPAKELEKISARDKAIEEKIQKLAEFGLERKDIEAKRGVNPLTQALTNLRGSEEYKTADNFDQFKMIGNTMWDKRGDLGGYAAGIALESLPSTVPTIAAAMAAKFGGMGPKGAAIMGGSGSALTEFGNQYADLRSEGLSHEEAWEKAGVKSAVIGLFDAASFKSAGSSAGKLFKDIEKGYIKEAAKETGKEVSKQAMYGMAGEGLGSVAINQKVDPLSVIEEGIGEIAGAPLEAVSTFKSKQQEAIDAANKPPPTTEVNQEQELATIAATLKQKYNLSDEKALQQANEVLRQRGIVNQMQQPAPPPGPVIQSAEGTPIPAMPLDTAIKATAAQAAAPNIEAQVQAKAAELGIPLADAQKLVLEETQNGTQQSNGVVPGANQPSVSVSQNGLQPAGGVTTSQPTGLDGAVGPAALPGARTEAVPAVEPSALTPEEIKNEANWEANKLFNPNQTPNAKGGIDYGKTTPAITNQISAFILGAYDAAQGLTPKVEEYKNKAQKEAYLKGMQFTGQTQATAPTEVTPTTPTETTPTPPAVTPEVTPVPTKGKRIGRPAAVLTPEQQAEKKQTKAGQTKEWKATDKTVTAAQEVLNATEPVREDFKTQDAYLEAGMRYRSERNQALDTLHTAATGPFRGGKLGEKAKAGLDHPSISTNERTSLKERVELRKNQPVAKVSKSTNRQTYETSTGVWTYFEPGAVVNQDNYPGRPAKVVEVINEPTMSQFTNSYIVEIDVEGDPEGGFDENGNPRKTTTAYMSDKRLNDLNPPVAKVSKSAQTTTSGTYNAKYEKFTTTQQVINHILANGTTFERFLARRLAPFLKGVNLYIVNDEATLPELRTTDGTLKDSFKGALGLYAQWTRPTDGKTLKFIFLRGTAIGNTTDDQGLNNTVFLHEALHAAVNARIDEYLQLIERGSKVPAELANAMYGLQMAMVNAQDAFLSRKLSGEPIDPRVDELFNRIGAFDDVKEFVSYGLTEETMQEFLLTAKGEAIPDQPGLFKTLFNSFTESIRKLFSMDRDHQSALQDLILVTEGLLQYEPTIEVPGVSAARKKKAKVEKVDRDVKKVMLSQKIHEITEGLGGVIRDGHDFQDYKDYLNSKLKGMGQDAIHAMLYVLRTSDIIRWMGDKIPGLKEIDDFTQKMSGMRTSMLDAYAKKTDELAEWLVSHKGGDKILGNAMHLARLKGVTPDAHATAIDAVAADPKIKAIEAQINDPATPAEKLSNLKGQVTRRKNDIQIVYDVWEQLGKLEGGHEMYKMVRQFYKDNYSLTRNLLDERIERLQELPGDVADEKSPKGQLMAEIRKMQEKDAIKEYFPLMRHGAVWLREAGADKGFILFDSASQRELYKIKKARDAGKSVEQMFTDNQMSEGNDINSLRRTNQRESAMLKNMFEIIDGAKMDELSSEELKDQLYQTWLMTLPEASIRKQFLHAENVAGFSADVFRNFTESANRIASQIPRLKYADQTEAQITRAKDSLAGNPEQAKLGLFIDAVSRRAIEQLNPPDPNTLASLATRYAYYMLLTGAMSAAVQLVAVPVMIYPVMAARYGVGRASAKFAAYSNILNSMGYQAKLSPDHLPIITISVADSARVKNNKTLSKAYAELKDRGLFAFTENNLLSQRGRTPLNATLNMPKKVLRVTANIMSGLFSGSERVSREIASMMAFELHYEKTKNFDESIEKAVAAVQDNMGRYDAMERPEAFKYAPVISQFKMYAANMTSFFIRHAYTSTQVMKNPKEAAESMKILGGVLMMGAMFHGLKGMPLYSTVGAVVEALSDLGEDDEEKKRRRAQNPLVYQNSDLRFRRFLQENFGPVAADMLYSGPISSVTDINIGSRTSFDNLWFRGGQPAKTNKEAFNNFVLANIGPAVSGVLGQAGALDDFENGHIERGLEKALPAFFKNPLVAARLATEGAKTKAGDTIIKKEDITVANVLAQAAGSPPTRLARTQEIGYELKGEHIKASQDRTKILQRMNDAILNKEFNGDKKDLQPVINQIRQHNKKYIGMEKLMVDGEAIDNTLNAALDARALTYKGVRIPTEDMLPYFIPVLKQGQK
ncbi:MAG: PLxRFG domain-containing protein [Methylococcaceae bacterium]